MAIINEGYFPQHSQSVCVLLGVCVCSGMGEQEGAMSPSTLGEFNCEMHIEVAITHSYHHFLLNCFCACVCVVSEKTSSGVTEELLSPRRGIFSQFPLIVLSCPPQRVESPRRLYTYDQVELSKHVCACFTVILFATLCCL